MVYESIGKSPVSWAGKPYPEITEIAEQDGSVVVVPVASLEQHGPHMPTATDTILADAVATGGAEHVHPDVPVLVTPPVWTGYSPHHLAFGATITLSLEEMIQLTKSTVTSAVACGFDAALVLNGHGGNASIVANAASDAGIDADAEILGLTYFSLAEYFIDEIRDSENGGIAHAGEMETSMMLHLRPDLVDEDALDGTYWRTPYDDVAQEVIESSPLSMYLPMEEYTESGALGDPELASAEKGERMYEGFVEEVGRLLREIHDRNAD
jgi:creatinine amidohydrolase